MDLGGSLALNPAGRFTVGGLFSFSSVKVDVPSTTPPTLSPLEGVRSGYILSATLVGGVRLTDGRVRTTLQAGPGITWRSGDAFQSYGNLTDLTGLAGIEGRTRVAGLNWVGGLWGSLYYLNPEIPNTLTVDGKTVVEVRLMVGLQI